MQTVSKENSNNTYANSFQGKQYKYIYMASYSYSIHMSIYFTHSPLNISGYYCNNSETQISCPPAYYCPENATQPTKCPAGSYCTGNYFDTCNCTDAGKLISNVFYIFIIFFVDNLIMFLLYYY